MFNSMWDKMTESMHAQNAIKDAQTANSLAGSRGTFMLINAMKDAQAASSLAGSRGTFKFEV